jgi:hypothetical protein
LTLSDLNSCGSGTFLIEAVSRLRRHLDAKIKCHSTIELTDWEAAAQKLATILHNIVGIDIHPFATFLTTVNVFFQIVDLYAIVRQNNPGYKIGVRVYTRDSLVKGVDKTLQKPLDVWINGRQREAERRLDMSHEVLIEDFDFVFGNPPWGNVLKKLGPLASAEYRNYLEKNYAPSASGKYDICVLFLHRGLEWLHNRGTLAMVVNNWFLVRSFGEGIRNTVMKNSAPHMILDFGQQFFRIYTANGKSKGAMNNPVILVLRKTDKVSDVHVVKVSKKALKNQPQKARRSYAIECAREALKGNLREGVEKFTVPLDYLKENIENGWLLAHSELLKMRSKLAKIKGSPMASLFNDDQGVTTGLNSAYVLTYERARESGMLEENLTRRVVQGRDIKTWKIIPSDSYIVYPYARKKNRWSLAFSSRNVNVLDLETAKDSEELAMNVKDRLNHRIAKGLVGHPNTASYLIQNYEALKQRKFEGKLVEEYTGAWYAYHRRRDPEVMTSNPKILTPRLVGRASFALDEEGLLPLDSVIALAPNNRFDSILKKLSNRLKVEFGKSDLLKVFLAFINSPVSDFIICLGRPRTPKGDYSIDEKLLLDLELPTVDLLCSNIEKIRILLKLAKDCIEGKSDTKRISDVIIDLYQSMFGISGSDLKRISEWHREFYGS